MTEQSHETQLSKEELLKVETPLVSSVKSRDIYEEPDRHAPKFINRQFGYVESPQRNVIGHYIEMACKSDVLGSIGFNLQPKSFARADLVDDLAKKITEICAEKAYEVSQGVITEYAEKVVDQLRCAQAADLVVVEEFSVTQGWTAAMERTPQWMYKQGKEYKTAVRLQDAEAAQFKYAPIEGEKDIIAANPGTEPLPESIGVTINAALNDLEDIAADEELFSRLQPNLARSLTELLEKHKVDKEDFDYRDAQGADVWGVYGDVLNALGVYTAAADNIEAKLESEKNGEMLILLKGYREVHKGKTYNTWVIRPDGEQVEPSGHSPKKPRGSWEGQIWWNDVVDLAIERQPTASGNREFVVAFMPKEGLTDAQRQAVAQIEQELNVPAGSFELDRNEAQAEAQETQVCGRVEAYLQERFGNQLDYGSQDWPAIQYNFLKDLDDGGAALKILKNQPVGITETIDLPGVGILEIYDQKKFGSHWLHVKLINPE